MAPNAKRIAARIGHSQRCNGASRRGRRPRAQTASHPPERRLPGPRLILIEFGYRYVVSHACARPWEDSAPPADAAFSFYVPRPEIVDRRECLSSVWPRREARRYATVQPIRRMSSTHK